MNKLQHTVLVTGANRGIGLEYVTQYAQAGWHVIACCRDPLKALELNKLANHYSNLQIRPLDVSQFDTIDRLAQELSHETIHVLISNAGIYPPSHLGRINYDAWLEAFRINCMATAKLAEAFLPLLKRAGESKLIAMTSKMGSVEDNGSGGEYAYRSSKTALNMVVKSLSIDLADKGVIVVALHPGWVRTDMGGPNGLIDTKTSVSGLINVIDRLTIQDSGRFMTYDGQTIPW